MIRKSYVSASIIVQTFQNKTELHLKLLKHREDKTTQSPNTISLDLFLM